MKFLNEQHEKNFNELIKNEESTGTYKNEVNYILGVPEMYEFFIYTMESTKKEVEEEYEYLIDTEPEVYNLRLSGIENTEGYDYDARFEIVKETKDDLYNIKNISSFIKHRIFVNHILNFLDESKRDYNLISYFNILQLFTDGEMSLNLIDIAKGFNDNHYQVFTEALKIFKDENNK